MAQAAPSIFSTMNIAAAVLFPIVVGVVLLALAVDLAALLGWLRGRRR